jgi:hypothetical protein
MTQFVQNQQRYFTVTITVPEARGNRDLITGRQLATVNGGAVSAVSRPITNTTAIKRKASAVERHSTGRWHNKRRKTTHAPASATSTYEASDKFHIGTKQRHTGKSCGLCKEPGHQIGTCPKITVYGVEPLSTKRDQSLKQRDMLVRSLDVKDHYLTFLRSDEETRKPVYTQVPSTAVRGIVLHDRMILTQHGSFQNSDRPGNYCFRATVLGEFGDPRPNYERVWFDSTAIQRYLLKGTSSIVIDKMELNPMHHSTALTSVEGGWILAPA